MVYLVDVQNTFRQSNLLANGNKSLFYAITSLLCAIFCSFSANSQDFSDISNVDSTYKYSIKTVSFYTEGDEIGTPIIKLGLEELLFLSFDDLEGENRTLTYTIIHCDANWNTSDLSKHQYMDGFYEQTITDYQSSFSTLKPYVHYQLTLPNNDINPKLSGNYLLVVYEDYDPDKIILTRRFMVVSPKVEVNAEIIGSSQVDRRRLDQRIRFDVNHVGIEIYNPFNEVKVVVRQNRRWDNAKFNIVPRFAQDYKIVYDSETELNFPGGNEFRKVDFRSLRFQTENISDIEFKDNKYYIYLLKDQPLRFKRYLSSADENGKYFIRNKDGSQPEYDADYAEVTFTVDVDYPLIDADLYLYGALSDFQCQEDFKLTYDYNNFRYTGSYLLKQGYYNYQYALKDHESGGVDLTFIDGSHFETENFYEIFVYIRRANKRYDELIAYEPISRNTVFK
ncbi:MAG: hypothetical protein ACJAZ3_000916 [Sphingobacteriales bacterium]|jgi:hypothetical protein